MKRIAGPRIVLAALMMASTLGLPVGAETAQSNAGKNSAATNATAATVTAWVLGISRFSSSDPSSKLADSLPRLIAAKLKSLPARVAPEAEAAEAAALIDLRARFTAGADLASKLDTRAASFLDPAADENAREQAIIAADKQIADSAKKLETATEPKSEDSASKPGAPAPELQAKAAVGRTAKLWDGHAKEQLIDSPDFDLAKAAKAANVDFLVTGSLTFQSGYAKLILRGYDVSLGREVFAWKSFVSADDPEPLAAEMAIKLERWVAGRDYARLAIEANPSSAEVRVEDHLLSGNPRVAYSYSDEPLHIEISAPGFVTLTTAVDIALGERKTIQMSLRRIEGGAVSLETNPPGAAISLDSVPIGKAPLSIDLDGSRGIVMARAEGMETQTVVLPASGDSSLNIDLLPSDGLGPSGRIKIAKDDFLKSLGWFILSLPVTTLSSAVFTDYNNAYALSGSESIYNARTISFGVLGAAIVATGVSATFMIIRLVHYLAVAH
jgi:hypothetical protein